MSTLVTTTTADELAPRINEEHDACVRCVEQFASHAFKAGDLLIEAKGLVPHGQWLDWLAEHTDLSERTAQAYMQMADRIPVENRSTCCGLSMREILESIKAPRLVEDHSERSEADGPDDTDEEDDAGDEESDDGSEADHPQRQFRKTEDEYAAEIVNEVQADLKNLEDQDLDLDLLRERVLEKLIFALKPEATLVLRPGATLSAPPTAAPQEEEKKRGGRPKGSKNKPKTEPASAETSAPIPDDGLDLRDTFMDRRNETGDAL